jgi:hypothetical protein
VPDFSGTLQPDEDPLRYRGYDTPVDRELSQLRTETANHILDLTQRVTGLQRKISTLVTLLWVLLLLVGGTLATSGAVLWQMLGR